MPSDAARSEEARSAVLIPENIRYRLKDRLLGKPLVSDELEEQTIGKPTALAILSSDVMSSCAYATEQILGKLVAAAGVAAFSLVMPVTGAVLVVLLFVTLSYQEVIKAYPKAGGAYVVSRENFGLNVAQVATAALLIDYTLTVAVSIVSGTDALTSAFAQLRPYTVEISVGFVLLIAFGNLRGIKEAGRIFALPTFFFIANMAILLGVGVFKYFNGTLVAHRVSGVGQIKFGHPGSGLLMGVSVFAMLAAFANGGSALTGTEAISNGVSVFRKPQVRHARQTLAAMALILGTLFLGVSFLSSKAHPLPFSTGSPSVLSQIGEAVYGTSAFGHLMYYLLQAGTMFILVLAANTSFTGFPFLASFAAKDSFLPRQLMRRGHRLVFSNGIIVLTLVAVVLIVVAGGSLDVLISLYAIGVFTGFTMAGAGMVKHHLVAKQPHWKRSLAINFSAAVLSAIVGLVFIVTKFTSGAWVVVILMPLLVYFFIRLHRQYEIESEELEEGAPRVADVPPIRRHAVVVMIDSFDLASLQAIRYARSLNPDELHAVHFVIDAARAQALSSSWRRLMVSRFPLELVECPDRRLVRATLDYAGDLTSDNQTAVSILLPRRSYDRIWSRLLHDRTADRIAEGVALLTNVNATIIPFHLGKNAISRSVARRQAMFSDPRHDRRQRDSELVPAGTSERAGSGADVDTPVGDAGSEFQRQAGPQDHEAKQSSLVTEGEPPGVEPVLRRRREDASAPSAPRQRRGIPGQIPSGTLPSKSRDVLEGSEFVLVPGAVAIGTVRYRQKVKVAGRVKSVRIQPWAGVQSLECLLDDSTGSLPLVFVGRSEVPGIAPGAKLVAKARVCEHHGRLSMLNPDYEFLAPIAAAGESH